MSWGWKITFLYASFVLLILTFVIASTKQNFDLVTEDYYAKEVAYQQQIDRQHGAQSLADPLTIRYEAASQRIVIDYPDHQPEVEGQVLLYRPANAGMDQTIAVNPDSGHLQHVSTQGLIAGLWKVQVTWRAGDHAFYQEQVVVL
jgi:hypothetical protein